MPDQTMTAGVTGTTNPDVIAERMPDSAQAVSFVKSFGRTFECGECNAPVRGKTCRECGYTPPAMRDHPDRRASE